MNKSSFHLHPFIWLILCFLYSSKVQHVYITIVSLLFYVLYFNQGLIKKSFKKKKLMPFLITNCRKHFCCSQASGEKRAEDNVVQNLPLLMYKHHRSLQLDYLPTLREISRTEHNRQIANTKRRYTQISSYTTVHLSLVIRKAVFGVSGKVRHKPAPSTCTILAVTTDKALK